MELLAECRPDSVAIENIFYAANVRSALKLGHARGVAMLAAAQAGLAGRRVHAGRDQAGGCRIRPRGEAAGPADGQAAPRSGRRPVASRCGRRAGGRHLPRALVSRRRALWPPPTSLAARALGARQRHELAPLPARTNVIAHLRGRISREAAQPHRDRRQRRRLRRVGSALDLLRSGRRRQRHRAAHSHACPRGCAGAVRVCDVARARSVRTTDRRQRHRPEARAGGAVRHRAARARARHRAGRRRTAHGDSGRRQEDLRAHRRRAEGSIAAASARGRGRRGRRRRGVRPARRCALGAGEPGVSSAALRKSCRCGGQGRA